ncbi:class I SAM-dependent DNA methyltransferase [Catellatospora tritici]|uniref:class I SAM-dependent DNA methyltransferase n=1 Tax=Catellatospora tritici TaxID=2851566 RepID=UPI001C2CD203|nr:class I SAM-dependent methyltransferase [Catellatospora tritici]MBV1852252.1 methyltransferase domain-containing protein [Catellatospora tritici]
MTESRAVFDRIGATYSEAFADKPGQLAAGQWLLDRLAGRHYPLVLDVGCGTGSPTARQLVDAGCHVVGIDTSPVMLELARHTVPEAIFVERDLFDLDGLHPTQQRFDGVVAFFSLLMLPRVDVERALDDVRHVLATDGAFALGMVEGDSDHLERDFLGAKVPLTAYSRDALRELLQRHGFRVEDLRVEDWQPNAEATSRLGGQLGGVQAQTHLYACCTVV